MSVTQREILLVLCLSVAVAIPFLPVLQGEFTNWDDHVVVTGNPYLSKGVADGLVPLVTKGRADLYVPVTYLVYWMEFRLWGANAFCFHFINMLIHIVNVALVYVIFRRLLSEIIPAALATLWWGVHPLHVEPVAWVTGLKDVLSGLFVLVSLYLYLTWRRTSPDTRRRRVWMVSLLTFLLAGFSKPASAAFPLVLIGYEMLVPRQGRRGLLATVPYFVVSAVIMTATILAQQGENKALGAMDILTRVHVAANSFLFYAQKAVWPVGLSPIYGRMVQDVVHSSALWLNLLGAGAICVIGFLPGWRWRLASVIFIAGIAPISGVVPFAYQRYSTVADRYMYFSLLGVALILGDIVSRVSLFFARRSNWPAIIASAGMICWAFMFGLATYHQTAIWHDSISVWNRALQTAPNYGMAYYNRGSAWLARKSYDLAIDDYTQAISLDPNHADAWNNRGTAWGAKGDRKKEIADYTVAIRIKPDYVAAYNNRGVARGSMGDRKGAIEDFTRAIELRPDLADAYGNRAVSYYRLQQYAEAWADVNRCRAHGGDVNPRFIEDLSKASGKSE